MIECAPVIMAISFPSPPLYTPNEKKISVSLPKARLVCGERV
jgi:hypothetical protein